MASYDYSTKYPENKEKYLSLRSLHQDPYRETEDFKLYDRVVEKNIR